MQRTFARVLNAKGCQCALPPLLSGSIPPWAAQAAGVTQPCKQRSTVLVSLYVDR